MAPSKIRQALGAVKDKTSIGLAKVTSSSDSISDLDVAIVKATRHDEYPAEERHIREILSLTSYSRAYISQCVSSFSRRLGKTRSWTVALKTLILVHRLLTEGDPIYEQEIFFATRRGTRMLNVSDFRDKSRTDAWDFSAFVRTYARYLDEMLEYRMHGRRGRGMSHLMLENRSPAGEHSRATSCSSSSSSLALTVRLTPGRAVSTEQLFTRTQHLQQLLDRFLACKPTGAAKFDRIVGVALYPLVKESCQIYFDLQEIMAIFIDRFADVDIHDCIRIYDIFDRLSKQFDDLDNFYSWCKTVGISRPSEIPQIERITQEKLEVMDEFIRDRCNLAANGSKVKSFEELTNEEDARREAEAAAAAYQASQIKALPAAEPIEEAQAEFKQEAEKVAVERAEEPLAIVKVEEVEEEVDFLNIRADAVAVEDNADRLALALFDGQMSSNTANAPAWETFGDDTEDWETALVQSASNLSGQRAVLGGHFDMLLLDGMYNQPRPVAQLGFADGNGSASSMVPPKDSQTLALPAPPTSQTTAFGRESDPFVASLSVPAPSYVQMTEMEKKQLMVLEEQMLWQQYARDGMQGQVSLAKLQQAQAAGMMQYYHPMAPGYVPRF